MKKHILFLVLTLLIFTHSAFSKDFSVHKLKSGQILIVKEVHNNPIVTIDTWIKTGSINETDENNGVAHFLEHMFFKGTNKYPTGKFDQILESKGAITNAATSKDYTHYYIEIPSKYYDLAMELHSDMLLNPVLPRNELEMERKVVLEEMARGNDNPDSVIYKKMNAMLYDEHPYKREVIGLSNVIETISREKMLDFYNTWYKPDNMITVVVGDIKTNDVIKNVEKNFKVSSEKKSNKPKYKKDKIKTNIPVSVTNMDTQTGYLLIGFRGVNSTDKDDSAALDVLATILGNGKSSRLYQNLQEQKHLTTSIVAGHSSYLDDSLFYIKAKFPPKNQLQVESEIWNQLKNIQKYPISDNEIKKAKNIIKNDTLYSRESVSNIANELGYITLLTGSTKYYNNYLKDIEKVDANDIKEVAQKYLSKNKAAVAYIMPNGINIQNPEQTKPQKTAKYEDNITINQIQLSKATAKEISSFENTKKYQLENGLILIITKNIENDIISMNMLSKGGYFQDNKIQKGTGNLLSDLLMKGTKSYTSQQISTFLDEKGIEISTQMQPDAFSTSIKSTKDEFKNALNIFYEIINNALLDEEELANAKNKRLQNIKTSKDIPSNLAFDEMKYLLWENTPYQNSFKILEKAYENVTSDNIKKLYSEIYSPQNTIVSINGNVDENYVIDYFSTVFSDKKASSYDLKTYQSQIYPMIKDKTSNITKNSNQAWVIVAYRTPPLSDIKDWATLKVIDSLLGTGMSSRLFTELRDQKGLAYTVASIYQSNALQGVFLTYIGTNPNSINETKNGMLNQITTLKRNFVSSKELEQAKERLLGNYIISQETNSEKAHTMSAFELYNRGYDFEKEYFDQINSVTEQDIIEVANKYFSKPKVTVVVK